MTSGHDEPRVPPASRMKIRVLYADTDMMGVVYHANYLRWFEAGRGDYMRRRGISYGEVEKGGVHLPVVEARAEYLRPARYDDVLDVETRVARADGAQVVFEYTIRKGDEVLVRGSTRHAAVADGRGATRLPRVIRDTLLGPETGAGD